MFSDTFNHRHCSTLCWQLSSADANACSVLQEHCSTEVNDGWCLAWDKLGGSPCSIPDSWHSLARAVLTGSAHYQGIRHELVELVVNWTVPCSIAAEPAAHRLISYLLKGPAPVTEFAAAACVWGTLLGIGSWGRWRDFLQQVFLI